MLKHDLLARGGVGARPIVAIRTDAMLIARCTKQYCKRQLDVGRPSQQLLSSCSLLAQRLSTESYYRSHFRAELKQEIAKCKQKNMASGLVLDTDSEDELPAGWEERVTDDGRVYYASHESRQTQWQHPVTARQKTVSTEMPYGWEKKCNTSGKDYYINHITQKMTTTDPRLAYAVEVKETSGELRQRFDASSTGMQVLQGRDLTALHAVVTGANSGIGFETARSLALHGAHVVFACRNMKTAQEAVNTIKQERPAANVDAVFLDLTSLYTVQQFATNYINRQIPLNILVLNAGVFSVPFSLTDDGYEMTFQTNHLGHFYLVQLLTDVLIKSTPARVVTVSSESHRFTDVNERTICESLLSPPNGKYYWPIFAYNSSKMCNLLFTFELHRRLSSQNVLCFAVHPGNVIATRITRHSWLWKLLFTLVRPFAKSKQQGAATTVYCATARELEGISGYYFNNCFQCSPAEAATNTDAARHLWDISQLMIARARTLHSTAVDIV